jgi:molybdopterin synthase sulfur carrier subunit
VEVRYFADIRPLAGTSEEERTAVPPTVNDLLAVLAAEKGPAFENRVFPGGKLSDTMIILVNGRNILHLNGVQTPLNPDDVVAVFPMVAGG